MIGSSHLKLVFQWIKAKHDIQKLRRANSALPIVSYAHVGFPESVWGIHSVQYGGSLKYCHLDKSFPHAGLACNILYVVSNGRYPAVLALLKKARQLGIHVVWNQDGALFPSAYGVSLARKENRLMARQMSLASYVFYQSEFAKKGSDLFLGTCACPCEILHNSVDTSVFVPSVRVPGNELILLSCGSHNDSYRLPLALDVLETLHKKGLAVQLRIAGRMSNETERTIKNRVQRAGIDNLVQLLGEYNQEQAPDIYHSADLLLHTQYNDVCPSVVLEAMSCGLPVVYSKTGGTPELVGDDAGYGVFSELNWNVAKPPHATALAEAVIRLSGRIVEAGRAARKRVVWKFSLDKWIKRHEEVFQALLGKSCD